MTILGALLNLNIQIAKPLEPLFTPRRYKVAYGGRDSAKSWGLARALLVRAWQQPTRILCARELQSSIKDSVKKLLEDQITLLGMSSCFDVQNNRILGCGPTNKGTEILFEGLRFNVDRIKSFEGVDIVWVEEAKNVSRNSWQVLIPTIRKGSSEIWVSFNPELETDETYQRFVANPPPNAFVVKMTYHDNPWLSQVSKDEIEYLRRTRPDDYLHIYEGHCRVTLDGAIYADELRAATQEGRITKVPYDESVPVHTFWDLGWADCTSIWFVQKVGYEYRIIDCFQDQLKKTPYYVKALQDRGYVYGTHYLPHDGNHQHMNSDSIAETLRKLTGCNVVTSQRVPKKELAFPPVRQIFPHCWFDKDKCADGIQSLRHYRYDVDEFGQWSKQPLHDDHSHFADAFAEFGRSINRKHETKEIPQVQIVQYTSGQENTAWMG